MHHAIVDTIYRSIPWRNEVFLLLKVCFGSTSASPDKDLDKMGFDVGQKLCERYVKDRWTLLEQLLDVLMITERLHKIARCTD